MALPADMVEEILARLPLKSLLRFSSVSKSLRSLIFSPAFVKRYRGLDKIVLIERYLNNSQSCPASSISSAATEPILCPFDGKACLALAWCDELWLGCEGRTLFLWNPSMRSCKKLPNHSRRPDSLDNVYGLGYDSVADDYKILKIPNSSTEGHEVYSMRSGSWRDVPNPNPNPSTAITRSGGGIRICGGGVYVSGNLHWMNPARDNVIVAFDLSEEKYGEVAHPSDLTHPSCVDELTVLRGMLCEFHTEFYSSKCHIWVMEEYGVVGSWTKKFSIAYTWLDVLCFEPLYLYEDGEILVRGSCKNFLEDKLIVFKDDNTIVEERLHRKYDLLNGGILHVESLVTP